MGYRDVAVPVEVCGECKAEVARGTRICPACHTPMDIAERAELVLKLEPALRKARRFLAVVAGLGVVELGLRRLMTDGRPATVEVLDPLFFAACWLAAGRWPLGASITAMSAFVLAQSYAIGRGSLLMLFSGLLFKVIFLVLLTASIRAGYRVRDLRGQWSKRARNGGIAALIVSGLVGYFLGLLR